MTLSREQGGDHTASVMERIVDDNMKFNFYTAKDRDIVSTGVLPLLLTMLLRGASNRFTCMEK